MRKSKQRIAIQQWNTFWETKQLSMKFNMLLKRLAEEELKELQPKWWQMCFYLIARILSGGGTV